MALKKKKTRSTEVPVERIQEKVFQELSSLFRDQGILVRREALKRGFGWSAASGRCRKEDEKILFVDRRSPKEEQLAFLVQEAVTALEISQETLGGLSSQLSETLSKAMVA